MVSSYSLIVEVDDLGKVLGPTDYRMAHSKEKKFPGIRHLTTNSFIFKDESMKDFLCQRRGPKVTGANKYDLSLGGHVAWIPLERRAETLEETLRRKLGDELFYEKEIPPSLKMWEICSFLKTTRVEDPEFIHLFVGIYPGPFYPNSKQVSELIFKDLREVLIEAESNPEKYTITLIFDIKKFLGVLSKDDEKI